MKRSELKEAIKAEIKSVLLEDQSKSAVHSLGKDLYDYLTNVVKMKGSLSSPIGGDSINSGQQFTVLINDNKGKFDRVTLRIPVGKDNINKEYIQKNIVDQVKRKYKELETKISQDNSSEGNRAIVDFTLTGPNLFQKVTEEIQVGDIVTLGGDGDELEVIDKREMFGSDMMAYRVKFPDGNTEEYSADQLRPTSMMHDDPGDIRIDHDYYTENLKEEDEPTSAELKKKDSVATISNKLQKLTAKMKKKAKEFKEAEGKAKDKLKDELKDMTAEKKKLEKSL